MQNKPTHSQQRFRTVSPSASDFPQYPYRCTSCPAERFLNSVGSSCASLKVAALLFLPSTRALTAQILLPTFGQMVVRNSFALHEWLENAVIDAGLATEQSLICVTWFHDPSDLPQLAGIAKQYNPSDLHGYAHSSVVMHMQTQYGTVALPYLRDILASSKQTWVRTAVAQGLVQMNDRAGWEFFIGVVRQRPFYRDEMVRWLGEVFPVIRDADDAATITFLTSRLANATAQQ